MGGSVLNREKRIICIDGDGSIMMNLQELQTISTNKLNIKIFLLNNNGYHSIRQTQRNAFSPPLIGVGPESNDLGFPDFEKLAQAFGISYAQIHALNSADEIIETVLQADGSILCEVVLDPDQNFAPKLSSKVMPDGSIVSPEIDDMFPFLDREEYLGNKLI
jgi:acetolactate synthase-1/2/3 large subunit